MKFKPEFKEAVKYASEYKMLPVMAEIFSDIKTPVSVLKVLKEAGHHCFLLESAEKSQKWGRYSFIGFNPSVEISCTNGVLTIVEENEEEKIYKTTNPETYIKEILEENKAPNFDWLPTFAGGLVGYFSYDFIKYMEPNLKLDAKDEEKFKDFDLMLFDKVIAFDNVRQKMMIIVNIKTDDIEENYENAVLTISEIANLIKTKNPDLNEKGKLKSEFKPLFTKEEFCSMVNKAKNYIKEGDIFQVVLSNRLEANYEGSLLNTYRYLRTTNPSPYMFYFSSDDIEIAGASPETLVKLNGDELSTFPLAGTRPRGKTEKEDMELEIELIQDKKELAEHNMLVDLGRNDLGKISKFGTVEVEKYMSVEKFSHVMHIGSTVKGIIQDDKTALDAIYAVLPAGTLSGAPKIRAMEIINELENNKRGIYGGAIGYIDLRGNLDTAIAIRIAFKKNNKVFVRSGAGIVFDSDPEKEYIETINKAKAVINAIQNSEEELWF